MGITPGRASTYDFAEVKRVCQDCTIAGLTALREANSSTQKPVKFVYLSGHGISQDFTTKPFLLSGYRTMRVGQKSLSSPEQASAGEIRSTDVAFGLTGPDRDNGARLRPRAQGD